ncbi:helix-turn-helix protein [Palleronia aestuarii]|uniref:Helix-turn-helix protein n=1 Tax=Palleronia aestuarii TaxID=568105 RepID=A0A2W7NGX5_9RHOB|nr:helix-turn-helix protein [Palleronia aestuarii]
MCNKAEAEQAVTERAMPPPDPAAAYARSVAELETCLGDPDLVYQAHEHIAVLIDRIVLTPNDSRADGIAAESHTDLGRFLCAGRPAYGETPVPRRFRTIASQLTATLGPMARHGSLRRTCELHMEYPFAGSRMLKALLNDEGHEVGRCHVSTLLKRMGVAAIYRRPIAIALEPMADEARRRSRRRGTGSIPIC